MSALATLSEPRLQLLGRLGCGRSHTAAHVAVFCSCRTTQGLSRARCGKRFTVS